MGMATMERSSAALTAPHQDGHQRPAQTVRVCGQSVLNPVEDQRILRVKFFLGHSLQLSFKIAFTTHLFHFFTAMISIIGGEVKNASRLRERLAHSRRKARSCAAVMRPIFANEGR